MRHLPRRDRKISDRAAMNKTGTFAQTDIGPHRPDRNRRRPPLTNVTPRGGRTRRGGARRCGTVSGHRKGTSGISPPSRRPPPGQAPPGIQRGKPRPATRPRSADETFLQTERIQPLSTSPGPVPDDVHTNVCTNVCKNVRTKQSDAPAKADTPLHLGALVHGAIAQHD